MLKAELEGAGIRAEVVGDQLERYLVGGDEWPSLWVADEAQLHAALPLVHDFEQRLRREGRDDLAPRGSSWRCPSCGTDVEPQFAVCWQCCADRPA
jgi:hypothetical protein